MTTNSTNSVASNQQLEPCPFCPATLSPFPKEHLPPDLRDAAGQWFQIVHNAGCYFVLLGFGDYPIHESRLGAWNTRSRVSVGGVVATVDRKAVLNAVDAFCAQYDSLGIRFVKLLKNAIRAVPAATASPAAPKEDTTT